MAELKDRVVFRYTKADDLDAYQELAKNVGPGMTNVPDDRKILGNRIENALTSINDTEVKKGNEYLFFIEDDEGNILGSSLIFAAASGEKGFYNFIITKQKFSSKPFYNKEFQHDMLLLNQDFDSESEIGGLLAAKTIRGQGIGRLLSLGRLMFIESFPYLFSDNIFAELRGNVVNGKSIFWDEFGSKFFGTDFATADEYCSKHGNAFIHDLLPSTPFYTCFFSEKLQNELGRPHLQAIPAYNMLLSDGFIYDKYIDIFDAGPLVHCMKSNLRVVKKTQNLLVNNFKEPENDKRYFVSNGQKDNFKIIERNISFDSEYVYLSDKDKKLLDVKNNDKIKICECKHGK